MTKENLLKYLGDPEYLHQISYQELKTVVAQHPSSLSLRYLLAVKSWQENNGDFRRQLAFLATYGIDRAHLFDFFNKEEYPLEHLSDGVILQEDYLELKELSELERELGTTAASGIGNTLFEKKRLEVTPAPVFSSNSTQERKATESISAGEDYYVLNFDDELILSSEDRVSAASAAQVEGNLAAIEDLFKNLETEEDELLSISEEEVLIDTAKKEFTLQETIQSGEFPEVPLEIVTSKEIPVVEGKGLSDIFSTKETKMIVPAHIEESLKVNPIPKSNFTTWYKQDDGISGFVGFDLVGFNSRGIIDELAMKKEEKTQTIEDLEKKKSKKEGLKKVIKAVEESLMFEEDIASETLAGLLVLQGHYSKARAMYEHLSLIFPEKSGLFAAEIKKIENLEDEAA